MSEEMPWQSFCEDVSILMLGSNMQDTNVTNLNFFVNKMDIKFNMFGSLMLDWVAREVDNRNIVTENHSRRANGKMKLKKEITNPTSLGYNVGNPTILGLSTGSRNSILSFGRP